jgi:hypothetical protein
MTSSAAETLTSSRAKFKDYFPAKPRIQNLFNPDPQSLNFLMEANGVDLDTLAEDPSYLLNTMYFSSAMSEEEPNSYYDAYDTMKRKKWLHEAYHEHLVSNVQSSS